MRYKVCGGLLAGALLIMAGRSAEAQCPSLPFQLTNGQTADASQVMANFNQLANCLNSGQLIDAPTPNLNITNSNGAITSIQSSGAAASYNFNLPSTAGIAGQLLTSGGPSSPLTWSSVPSITPTVTAVRELGPFSPPLAASFTFIDSPSSITPTVSDVTNVGMVYSVPVTSDSGSFPGAYQSAPTTPWILTIRAKYATLMGSYPEFGIWIKDTSGKMVGAIMEGGNGVVSLLAKHCNSNISYNSNPYVAQVAEVPTWIRVKYDGNNINMYVSWDGQNWIFYWTEPSSSFLNGNIQYVGIGGLTGVTNTSLWQPGSTTGAVVTYWNMNTGSS